MISEDGTEASVASAAAGAGAARPRDTAVRPLGGMLSNEEATDVRNSFRTNDFLEITTTTALDAEITLIRDS
jgi:hypothetical protein